MTMAAADAGEFALAFFNLALVIGSIAHEILKTKVIYESEETKQKASTEQEQQRNDNNLLSTEVTDIRNASNDNADNSPKKPVGFMATQFEPATKKKSYRNMRWIILGTLILIGILAVLFHFFGLAAKASATVTTGTTVNIEGTVLAKVYHGFPGEWIVWDPTDIVDPPVESTMFFVATRRVLTKNQTLREDCVQSDVSCRTDSDCASRFGKVFGEKGIYTGTCGDRTCTVRAWCPQEYNTNNTNAYVEVLNGSLNFAVLIKSHMNLQYVSGKNERHASIDEYKGNESAKCIYHKVNDPYCPRFNMSSIVHEATEYDAVTYDNLIKHGGVISIRMNWICQMWCELTYHFILLDKQNTSSVYKGFSSTDSEHDGDTDTRTFIRSTGIIFIVQIDGSGYRFSPTAFVVTTASAIVIVQSTGTLSELLLIIYLKKAIRLHLMIFASVMFAIVGILLLRFLL